MKGTDDTRIVQNEMGERLRAARGKTKRPALVRLLRESPKAPVESKAEMTAERLKQWEYGNNPISHEWIPAICEVLDCDVGYLFGEYKERHRISADIAAETGLTESAIQKIHNLRCGNQVDWLTDILNAIVEQEEFVVLLFYALNYTVSGNREVEVTGDRHRIKVCCKDIYRMKLSDTLEQLLSTIAARFEGREDYRHIYSLYRSMYNRPDKNGIVHSLDEIRTDMEANGLTFDPMLFEGGENNG